MTKNEDRLIDELTRAAQAPPPRNFQPGYTLAGGRPDVITTPPLPALNSEEEWEEAVRNMGIPIPEGHSLVLVEAAYAYSENTWQRDPADRGKKDTAYTGPNQRWSYKFKVVLRSLRDDPDIAVMMKEAARRFKARKALVPASDTSTMVIDLADFQVGKKDELGGTAELLDRNEIAMDKVDRQIRKMKPAQIILIDVGDSTEGYNSAPNAARVNDLQEVEALRVWRRIFWRWIKMVAAHGVPMIVVGVPSNHCSNRNGKQKLGPVDDDWGIDAISVMADLADENPEAYGHVEFLVPRPHEEHVFLTLVGGKTLAVHHGDRGNNPEAVIAWIKKLGRQEVGQADIINVGHFHHLRWVTFGDDQLLIIAPTMDGGSSWFTPGSGERSRPGVLTYMVDEDGARDQYVAWAA